MWVDGLKAYYQTNSGAEVKAVDGITFQVREGEVLGIAGESGCGKSTLASIMSLTAASNLKIIDGSLRFDDREIDLTDLANVPRQWRGTAVALLPQRSLNSLNPTRRIRDMAYDVIHAHEPQVSRRQAVQRASQRLEQLDLPPRVLHSYPHQLSGGMRQRVVTVISSLLNPDLLIADEPSSALDVSSQRSLLELLLVLKEQNFINRIVFITHDLALLSNIADRIAIMYAGEIVEIGDTAQIVNNPQHPYTKALLASILEPDPDIPKHRIEGIPGMPPDLSDPPPGCRFEPRCKYRMEICARESPPRVGTPDSFASCWWVLQQQQEEHIRDHADVNLTPA